MPVTLQGGAKVWQRRDRRTQFAVWAMWLLGTAAFVYCWSFIAEKTIWPFVLDAPVQAGDLAVRMLPPDWSVLGTLWRPMWDTLNMATLGTAIAVVPPCRSPIARRATRRRASPWCVRSRSSSSCRRARSIR
jgi:phosphonate transport system permease protein